MYGSQIKHSYTIIISLVIGLLLHVVFLLLLYHLSFVQHTTKASPKPQPTTFNFVPVTYTPKPVAELRQGADTFSPTTIKKQTPVEPEASAAQSATSDTPTSSPLPEAPAPFLASKPKQPSIIDMTRGYLDSIDYGGKDAFNRAGDRSIRPDLEDTQWISFKEKIFREINRSLRILGILRQPGWPGKQTVLLRIDSNGHALSIEREPSHSCKPNGKQALKVVKTALPFPPIPKHFGLSSLDMKISLSQKGNHFIAELLILNR